MRIMKRNCCSSSVMENQYLIEDDAGAHQHALEFGHGLEEFLVLLRRAETHHALDAGAVVPAAVEQDDLAAGRQVGHVALEIPLRALALAGGRQRRDAADPRIEALRDALDDAALAGGVAAFEDHDDLELLVLHPVLQLDQLALQPEQLPEIDATIDGGPVRMLGHLGQQLRQPVVVDLQLELLVEAVEHLVVHAILLPAILGRRDVFSHGPINRPPRDGRREPGYRNRAAASPATFYA